MPYKHRIKGKWTGNWLGQVRLDRKRTKLFPTKAEAKAWEVATLKQAEAPPEPEQIVMISLLEWGNKYMDHCFRYSRKTYSEKRNAFRRLFSAIDPATQVDQMTSGLALEHLQSQFRERTGYAANKERKNLGAGWNWGMKFIDNFPNTNPFLQVPKFPEIRQRRYVPPEKDFWKVVEIAQGQDRVLLLTFLFTAARRGEVYRLTWEDIDFSRREIRLFTRKRSDSSLEYDCIPMDRELFDVLIAHRQSAINEWVFVQPKGRQKNMPYTENRGFPQKLCEKAGVKPFGCHAIRHLTASILAKHGVPMVDIQQVLRHRKLATTERYIRGLESVRPHLKVLRGGLKDGKLVKAPFGDVAQCVAQ